MQAIKIRNVSKVFTKKGFPLWIKRKKFTAVRNVSLDINKGEVFGILGHNGCGKSTLIRMMSTLLIPDSGFIKVFGVDVDKDPNKVKEMINRVSVEASFLKSLSPEENLVYAARLYGIPQKQALKKAHKILKQLGFPKSKMSEPIEKCSRGLQQKVAIARGFLSSPMVVLLDEPTTGLDPVSKEQVMAFIKKLKKETDLTIVLTSHDMNEVEQLCDRVAVMKNGNLVALDTVEALKKKIVEKEEFIFKTDNNEKATSVMAHRKVQYRANGNNELLMNQANIEKIMTLMNEFEKQNIVVTLIQKKQPTMEEVFIKLTKGTARGKAK
jgi:ABC-2 type transport system ATP-binding protein